jgi:hypothetical protein
MSNRFHTELERLQREEYSGAVPRSVELIAQRVGSGIRSALTGHVHPDKLYEVELLAVDLAIQAIRESIYRERTDSGSADWRSGFGNVSSWPLNGAPKVHR